MIRSPQTHAFNLPYGAGNPTAPPAGEETTPLLSEGTAPDLTAAHDLNPILEPPTGDYNPTAMKEASGATSNTSHAFLHQLPLCFKGGVSTP